MTDRIRVPEYESVRHARDQDLIQRAHDIRMGVAFHWLGVYSWLIACEAQDMEAANAASALPSSTARRDATIDRELLGRLAHRYEQRRRHWQQVVTVDGELAEATTPVAPPLS